MDVERQRVQTSGASGHHRPPKTRNSLPPPYSDSSIVMALRDCASVTSPFEDPNVFGDAGCALASIAVLAQILLLERQTYRDIDLINGINHPRFRKVTVPVMYEDLRPLTTELECRAHLR